MDGYKREGKRDRETARKRCKLAHIVFTQISGNKSGELLTHLACRALVLHHREHARQAGSLLCAHD